VCRQAEGHGEAKELFTYGKLIEVRAKQISLLLFNDKEDFMENISK
jgi:hypothetical protein